MSSSSSPPHCHLAILSSLITSPVIQSPVFAKPSKRADASLWFLPAYSPDLNPIEKGFAKIKAHLRKPEPRSREALWNQTGHIVQDFTPNECANFLAHAGYVHSA